MQGIPFAPVVREAFNEAGLVQVTEVVFTGKFVAETLSFADDEPVVREQTVRLRDVNGADLSSPRVDVLEQVRVDSLQMLQVEVSNNGSDHEFSCSKRCLFVLEPFEDDRVVESRPVPQDVRAGVDVRVVHTAAR